MSSQPPWWYSAGQSPESDGSGSESSSSRAAGSNDAAADSPASGAPSLGDFVSMASTLVEWATDRFMAPHAEHATPAEHPQCLICRASRMLGAATESASSGAPGSPVATERSAGAITWIPIFDDPSDPTPPLLDGAA